MRIASTIGKLQEVEEKLASIYLVKENQAAVSLRNHSPSPRENAYFTVAGEVLLVFFLLRAITLTAPNKG